MLRFPNGFPNTLQSIGENEYGKTGHSKIFSFWRHFLIVFKRNFVSALTLLNNAFQEISLKVIQSFGKF